MASHSFQQSSLFFFLLCSSTIFQAFVILPSSAFFQAPFFSCSATNYTTNSTYQYNLKQLLSSLSSSGWHTGFSLQTVGEAPNRVYGRALCLDKLNSTECQTCLLKAVEAIQTNCSHSMRAGLWNDVWYLECFVRYSDTNSTTPEEDNWSMTFGSAYDIVNPDKFEYVYGQLMDRLAERAANSTKMFKAGVANYIGSITLYGLVQCMRDISPDTCYTCLKGYISLLQASSWGKEGGTVFGFQCYMRMEIYPFFNLSLVEVNVPPPGLPPEYPPWPEKSTDGEHNARGLIVRIVCPIAVVLLLVLVIDISLRLKILASANDGVNPRQSIRDDEFTFFELRTVKAATNNFSEENKLGEGGFGPVYKGMLENGRQVAVKRLSRNSQQGLEHFRNEVSLVAKLEHKNLVRLLGCCFDDSEKLLVYEYLCNTSLDKFLFDPVRRNLLTWNHRYKIIEGVGRGLLYLHQESRFKIIHRDLKASNILLDSDMNPKISDFGLAKLFDLSASQGNTSHIAGTYGYMVPEYAMQGVFSEKSDVFSYGVLVLEILTGQSTLSHQNPVEDHLLTKIWHHWRQGAVLEAVDRSLITDDCPTQFLIRCIHVGLLCVQENPSERPGIDAVLLMLSSRSMTLPVPSSPAFNFLSTIATGNQTNRNTVSTDAQKVIYSDVFSEMEAR